MIKEKYKNEGGYIEQLFFFVTIFFVRILHIFLQTGSLANEVHLRRI